VVLPASPASGQTVQLKAAGSAAIAGHSITQYAWTNSGGAPLTLANADTATASLVVPSCGVSAVRLTVTDDTGRQDSADVDVTTSAVTSDAPANAGDAGCSFTPPAIELAVCPVTATVQTGTSEPLTASIINTANTAVTWEVEGIPGGNATVGTVTSSGVYTAPASPPADGAAVTVSAVSVADASVTATSTLTITAPAPSGGGGGGALGWATLGAALAALGVRRRHGRRSKGGRR
jgi:hypothetical protein